jgi:hypothetical protein
MPSDQERIATLEQQVSALRVALVTALAWIMQSANSPLSQSEVEQLIRMADVGWLHSDRS